MRRPTVTASLLLCALLAALSCSVKEDRTGCPSWVTVNVDRFISMGYSEALFSLSSSAGLVARSTEQILPLAGTGYVQEVPRGKTRVAVVAGIERSFLKGDTLLVRKGCTADPLMISSRECYPLVDEYLLVAEPHKQYCRLEFSFPTLPEGTGYPFRFRIRTLWNGVNIYTLAPVQGEYEATVGPNHVGQFITFLPRQGEGTMLLDIYEPYSDTEEDGELQATLDLGALLEKAGYDWSREDLDDAVLTVDFSRADIEVRVVEWERDDTYSEVVI